MRQVQLIVGLGVGGGERLLEEAACAHASRHRVVAFSLKGAGAIGQALHQSGVAVRPLSCFGLPLPWRWAMLLAELARADIAHSHFFYADCVLALLARVGWVKGARLSSRHDLGDWMGPLHRMLEPLVYESFDEVLCVSHAVVDAMRNRGVDGARLGVLSPRPRRFPATQLRRGDGIVAVARLEAVKGVDVLLEALARLRCQKVLLPPVTIVGGGSMAASLRARAKHLGLAQRVRFTGDMTPAGVARELAQASIFCLPSRSDAAPVALLEAMSLGLAPVVSDTPGALALLGASRAGVVARCGDDGELAQALRALLTSPRQTRSLGNRAKAWVRQHYPPGSYPEALEHRYHRHLQRRHGDARGVDVCMLVRNTFVFDGRVERQAKALTRRGACVQVLAEGGARLPPRELRDGYDVVRLTGAQRGQRFARWRRTARFYLHACWQVLRAQPTVVHCHDLDTLLPGALAARVLGSRLVYDSHELWTERNHGYTGLRARLDKLRYGLLERVLIGQAAAVTTVSEGIADELQQRYGIRRPTVLRNVPEVRRQRRHDLRRRVGARGPLLLFLGQVQPRRGLQATIRALPALPQATLVLLGEAPAPAAAQLRMLAHREGVENRVVFLPPVDKDEIVAWAKDADVGLCLLEPTCQSHRLALPNKFFEYLHAGLPIVASDLPELRPWMRKYRLGASCDPTDSRSVARALRRVLAQPKGYWAEKRTGILDELTWEHEQERLGGAYPWLFPESALGAVTGAKRQPRRGQPRRARRQVGRS